MYNRRILDEKIKCALDFQELMISLGKFDLAEKDHERSVKLYNSGPMDKKGSTSFAWVGINPEVGAYAFEELYHYAVEKVPFPEYQMCVEQHTKGGIRPHIHLLVKVSKNTRKNHIIKRLAKLFNVADESVQVRLSCSTGQIDAWSKYLRGEKAASKLEDVAKDRTDRANKNIPDVYKCPSQ